MQRLSGNEEPFCPPWSLIRVPSRRWCWPTGRSFAADRSAPPGETLGEVVFNTAMTGYQEILTDPSYAGQIVTLTYPHIGNTGVNDEDVEAVRVHAAGLVDPRSAAAGVEFPRAARPGELSEASRASSVSRTSTRAS